MYNAVKKNNNLSVSRPPRDLSACAEHAPVLAQQRRSLQAGRCVSHTQDQKTLSGFTTHLPAPSAPVWQRAAAEVEQRPTASKTFLPSRNSHQQYSADRLKICPLITRRSWEQRREEENTTDPQNIITEVQVASKESQRIKLFKD